MTTFAIFYLIFENILWRDKVVIFPVVLSEQMNHEGWAITFFFTALRFTVIQLTLHGLPLWILLRIYL